MSTDATMPTEVDSDESRGQPPVARHRFGSITVSIWERWTKDRTRCWFEYSIVRSYRDDAGAWHNTYSFRADDSADVEMGVRWAHRWLRTEGKARSMAFAQQHDNGDLSDDIPF